jgi:hypothetical protein
MAVVMISGTRKEISMRKASVAAASPAPVNRAPVNFVTSQALVSNAPAPPPAVAGTPEQEQREARMLVSDLLEIGVQQRKAYQDAKQKAASGAPAPQN